MSSKQSAYAARQLIAKRSVSQAPVQRLSSRAARDSSATTAQQVRIDPRSLISRQVLQLQRAIGNQAVSALFSHRQETSRVSTASDTMVQMDEALPGRKKRRRQAQEEELAAMDAENAEWERNRDVEEADPYVNPFATLEDVVEQAEPAPEDVIEQAEPAAEDVVEQAKMPLPTIAELRSAGQKKPTAITERLVSAGYSEELARQMSRTLRSSQREFNSIADLERAARSKLSEQAEEPSSPPTGSSRTLNVRSGPVPNLKKGIGAGWYAGEGKTWHVHHDHVKFGKDDNTRVNFDGRSQAEILRNLADKSRGKPDTNLEDCRKWIRGHFQ